MIYWWDAMVQGKIERSWVQILAPYTECNGLVAKGSQIFTSKILKYNPKKKTKYSKIHVIFYFKCCTFWWTFFGRKQNNSRLLTRGTAVNVFRWDREETFLQKLIIRSWSASKRFGRIKLQKDPSNFTSTMMDWNSI